MERMKIDASSSFPWLPSLRLLIPLVMQLVTVLCSFQYKMASVIRGNSKVPTTGWLPLLNPRALPGFPTSRLTLTGAEKLNVTLAKTLNPWCYAWFWTQFVDFLSHIQLRWGMEGGHLKPLIVVVCKLCMAFGYFSRIKGLVQYHTKCPFSFFLSSVFLLFSQDNGAKFRNLLYLFKAIEDSSLLFSFWWTKWTFTGSHRFFAGSARAHEEINSLFFVFVFL